MQSSGIMSTNHYHCNGSQRQDYLDVGLEHMVPDQMWIEEECKFDIAAMYGGEMFIKIEVLSLYGYDYMKKIVLRRANLNEHIIAKDFKYLYLSDFEDLYLLNLQGHLNHLPPNDKKILTTATQLNLTKPRWDATGFEYKHDFTITESPRAVTFRDKYGVQMIMRFNEIYNFSDGTLQQIDEGVCDFTDSRIQVSTRMNLDKEDLPSPGMLCWWKSKRGRLPTSAANRMITSSLRSISISCRESYDYPHGYSAISAVIQKSHNEDGKSSKPSNDSSWVGDMLDPLWIGTLVTNGKRYDSTILL
ncbi:hypothetical protein Tco_0269319 [Tanacetum coccineum]